MGTEDDITKMLAATTHIGSDNSETTMEQYIFKKRKDGINVINLRKTREKLILAARAIAAVENPQDVFVVASRPYVSELSSSLQDMLAAAPSLVVSPLEHLLIRSRQ